MCKCCTSTVLQVGRKDKPKLVEYVQACQLLRDAEAPNIVDLMTQAMLKGHVKTTSVLFEHIVCTLRNFAKTDTRGWRWSITKGDKRLREFLLAVGLQSSGWKALEVRVSTVSALLPPSLYGHCRRHHCTRATTIDCMQVFGGLNEDGSRLVEDVRGTKNIPI